MKNQKGITLIALVITIIVLIILAGVSIAMLTGDNGILTNSNTAKEDTDLSAAADKINIELNAFSTDIRSNTGADAGKISDSTWTAATNALTGGAGTWTVPAKPSDYTTNLTISYTAYNKTVTGVLDLSTGKITTKATVPTTAGGGE